MKTIASRKYFINVARSGSVTLKHHSSAMLYIKSGSSYKLAALGGCEYER